MKVQLDGRLQSDTGDPISSMILDLLCDSQQLLMAILIECSTLLGVVEYFAAMRGKILL